MNKRAQLAVATVLAIGLVAAGVALGAIPDRGGVITACYKTGPSGTLRVVDAEAGDACAKNERALSWSQQGPQGEKGDPGAQGTRGPQGEPGTTGDEVYFASGNEIVSMTLPAGSYVLEADVFGFSPDLAVGGETLYCTLPTSTGTVLHQVPLIPVENPADYDSNAKGTGTFHSALTTAGGVVQLKCGSGSSSTEVSATLLATRVASVG